MGSEGWANTTALAPSHQEPIAALPAQLKTCADRLPAGHSDIVEAIVHRLQSLRHLEHAPVQIACRFELCRYYYITGTPKAGLDHGLQGIEVANLVGDLPGKRKLLTAYAALLNDSLNLPAAAEALCEALDVCDALDDPVHFSVVWINMSAVLVYAGLPSLAINAAETALRHLEHCRGEIKGELTHQALANIAYACLDTQQYSLGLRCAAKLSPSIDEQASAFEILNTAIYFRNVARLCLRVGDVESARQHVLRALELSALPRACARTIRCGQVALGLLEAYSGEFSQGVERIRSCLAEARQVEPGVEVAYLQALVEAYVVAGRQDEADAYRAEVATVVRRVRQSDLLFHHERHLKKLMAPDDNGSPTQAPRDFRGTRRETSPIAARRRKEDVLESLAIAAELPDDPSGKHGYRVSRLATLLAERIGVEGQGLLDLGSAALLHDIGKSAIPSELLTKKGALNATERAIVREHTTIGADLLLSTGLPTLCLAVQIARHHHEFWNGNGYPEGLSGEAIPLPARVVGIVEAFDAMTHDRPYRSRMTINRALEEIKERQGSQFDPRLVSPFMELIAKLHDEHGDLDAFLSQGATERSTFLQAQEQIRRRMNNGTQMERLIQ